MCLCVVLGFAAASRLQVQENARFVTKSGEVLEGTVSRDFISGDYVIKTATTEKYVAWDEFGAMMTTGRSVSTGSAIASILGLVLGFFVGFGGRWTSKRRTGGGPAEQ